MKHSEACLQEQAKQKAWLAEFDAAFPKAVGGHHGQGGITMNGRESLYTCTACGRPIKCGSENRISNGGGHYHSECYYKIADSAQFERRGAGNAARQADQRRA